MHLLSAGGGAQSMDRRGVLRTATAAGLALGTPFTAGVAGTPRRATHLRIARVLLQPARGTRSTPVAPKAYAPYRGYEATDPVLRIRTAQGLEGIGCYTGLTKSGRTEVARESW